MADHFDPLKRQPKGGLSLVALAVAVVALCASGLSYFHPGTQSSTSQQQDRLASIERSGVLRVGYGGYPPYTIVGSNPNAPTGFAVDLVNAIASHASPPLKVEWFPFSFDTMKADLQADRFDFIADPVFMTVPRSEDFSFSRPYSYFGIAVALVRQDEARFNTFADLDQAGVTIALAEGWTSSDYARAHLSKPTFVSVPVTGDATAQLDQVLSGRADVALNDVPTVLQYVRAHPGRVKALWLSNPPSSVAGGFVVRPDDGRLREFLSESILVLQADGTVDAIDKRWNSLGFFPTEILKPGAGIVGTPAAAQSPTSR